MKFQIELEPLQPNALDAHCLLKHDRAAQAAACKAANAFRRLITAHFSDRGRLFQADRGRRFSAIVDGLGLRASEVFNVSQSSTISLKRGVDRPLLMRPQGASWG